jgi:hypothetical protein
VDLVDLVDLVDRVDRVDEVDAGNRRFCPAAAWQRTPSRPASARLAQQEKRRRLLCPLRPLPPRAAPCASSPQHQLCDLHGVKSGSFEELVAANPERQTVLKRPIDP